RQYLETAERSGLKTIADIRIEQGATPLSRLEGYAATQPEQEEEEEEKPEILLNDDGIPTFIAEKHPGALIGPIMSEIALGRQIEREPNAKIYLYEELGEPKVLKGSDNQYLIWSKGFVFYRWSDHLVMISQWLIDQGKKTSEYPARMQPAVMTPLTELAGGRFALDGSIRLKGDGRFEKALNRASEKLTKMFGSGITLLVNNVRIMDNLGDGDAADPVGYTARRTNRDIEIDSRALRHNDTFLTDVLVDECMDVVGTWTEPDAGIRELAVLLTHGYSSMDLKTAADIVSVLEQKEFDPGKQFLALLYKLWTASERHDTDSEIRKLVMFVYNAPKYRQVRQLLDTRYPGIASEADVPQELISEVKRSQERMMEGIACLNELAAYAGTLTAGLKAQGVADDEIRSSLEKAGFPSRGDLFPPYEAVRRALDMFRIMNDDRGRILDSAA
ncbi:MAG TPA: hypothetical protein P5287_08155, partial [bacterium]|nr:hypothetical protein [bacterium]